MELSSVEIKQVSQNAQCISVDFFVCIYVLSKL